MDSLLAGEPAFAPIEAEPTPERAAPPAPEPARESVVQSTVEVTTTARIPIRDLEDGQRVRGVYAVRGRRAAAQEER